MKQTAVEFLLDELYKLAALSNLLDESDFLKARTMIFEKALKMEKEQIIDAWNTRAKIDGVIGFTDNRTAEQYYTETFKTE